jgi:DNA methylase
MTAPALGLRDHLTHRGNLATSRYGWLRLTPMYSVHLVEELIEAYLPDERGIVLDPFCGTGTTALVCAERGIACDTTDINPFLRWLTEAKCQAYTLADVEVTRRAADAVTQAIRDTGRGTAWIPPLSNVEKWWNDVFLGALSRAWQVINERGQGAPASVTRLLTIAFLRTAIKTARVSFGHQSMSFKASGQLSLALNELPVVHAWQEAITSITEAALSPILRKPRAILCDARELSTQLPAAAYSCAISSPPYCNRMSYIRELRPYMYWTGYLADGRNAGELDWRAIGGTWGIATSNVAKWEPPTDEGSEVPFADFADIVERICERSPVLGRYVAKYFYDVILHVQELAKVMQPGGSVHYIVGNSKFYDVMVPAEAIYAAVFEAAGFTGIRVRTIRKRTSKKELYEFLVSARVP